MLPNWLLFFLLTILPLETRAGSVESMQCEPRIPSGHECRIRIGGKINSGEKLFLPYAQDSDQLKFESWILGETGYLLRYPYSASQFPRVYSLQPLAGKENIDLVLTTSSYFPTTSRPPAKVRVIDETFSLRKVYAPIVLKTVLFGFLIFFSLHLLRRLRRQTVDGWMYPLDELRTCMGAIVLYFFLRSEWTHAGVPSFWTAGLHYFSLNLSMAVAVWAAGSLIFHARFYDRSCTDKLLSRPLSYTLLQLLDAALLVTLFLLLPPLSIPTEFALAPVTFVGFFLAVLATKQLEWRRILKRSAKSPLLFHLCLIVFLGGSLLASILGPFAPVLSEKIFYGSAMLFFASSLWRTKRYEHAKFRAKELSQECKEVLTQRSSGIARLFGICEFLEDEFGAARVSVLSIHQGKGLLLASAGPDAIRVSQQTQARKLGPFLKRVCREGHMLYAPVAEELEKELLQQGMKHSSLAFPFQQNSRVEAVLCMMADEGERIPAIEVAVLEFFLKEMELEILSCISQQVAEEKCERLLALARESNALAVDHLDTWGYLNYQDEEEKRFLLGLKVTKPEHLFRSPLLERVFKDFAHELAVYWQSIATTFEFVPKDTKQDFWVLSPTQFQNPYLQSLGAEKSTILLAIFLERAFHSTLAKPCFALLGCCDFQLAFGETHIRFHAQYGSKKKSIEVDAEDLLALQHTRDLSKSEILLVGFSGNACVSSENDFRITSVAATPGQSGSQRVERILSVGVNKKEFRKLEIKSLEILREQKKAA
jgi:hypothetical protein